MQSYKKLIKNDSSLGEHLLEYEYNYE